MEDRMAILSQVRSQVSTHNCPECSGAAYCAMEAGKSSNLCWCMTVDKPYTPDTNYGQCLCRRCLTKETNEES